MVDRSDIREQVRQRYADSARSISEQGGGCCGSGAYDGNVAPGGTVVLAGALTEAEYRDALAASGWTDVEIRYTHEVHEFAKAAIVRAVRP